MHEERFEVPGRSVPWDLGKVGMEGNVPRGEDPLVLHSELN